MRCSYAQAAEGQFIMIMIIMSAARRASNSRPAASLRLKFGPPEVLVLVCQRSRPRQFHRVERGARLAGAQNGRQLLVADRRLIARPSQTGSQLNPCQHGGGRRRAIITRQLARSSVRSAQTAGAPYRGPSERACARYLFSIRAHLEPHSGPGERSAPASQQHLNGMGAKRGSPATWSARRAKRDKSMCAGLKHAGGPLMSSPSDEGGGGGCARTLATICSNHLGQLGRDIVAQARRCSLAARLVQGAPSSERRCQKGAGAPRHVRAFARPGAA